MASIFWVSDSFRKHMAQAVHDLENGTYALALVTSSASCPETAWAGSTVYTAGNVVVPTTRNGHRYICTVGGTSSSTEPTWPTTADELVGTAPQWKEYGGDLCAHDLWADVSGAEVANGNGYATGGVELTTQALTQVYRDTFWTADNVDWTALTKTFRYAFLYKVGTTNGVVNGIVGYMLPDDTFIDKVISGINYRIYWSVNGILKVSK